MPAYTLLDVINEAKDDIADASISEMRRIMDAKKTKAPPAIEKIKSLLANKSEYELYEFLDNCEFWEVRNKNSPGWYQTAGVRAANDRIEFYYDAEFIEKIAKKPGELMFLIAHEASHIFRYHQDRTQKLGHDHQKANIAQDMIINHDIMKTSEIAGFPPNFIKGGMKMPEKFAEDYKHDKKAYYYENMYKWLEGNPDQDPTQQDDDDDEDGDGGDGQQQEKDYWEKGSIVKVNSGEHKGEYRKITSVNDDGSLETEPVDIEKEYEKVRQGK